MQSEFVYYDEIDLKFLEVKEMKKAEINTNEKIQIVLNLAIMSSFSEEKILQIYHKAFRSGFKKVEEIILADILLICFSSTRS